MQNAAFSFLSIFAGAADLSVLSDGPPAAAAAADLAMDLTIDLSALQRWSVSRAVQNLKVLCDGSPAILLVLLILL